LIHTTITAGTSRVAYGPLCLHAVAITPAGPMELVRSSVSIASGLPRVTVRSAPAIAFTHVTACTLAESPRDPLHRKLRQLRCLRCRFDCYRVERTSSRAGVAPAEVQRLFTAHCYANLLQSRCARPSSPREDREKNAIRNGYPRRVWGAALVHTTSCTTASRFAGRSANKDTITSVKFLWTL